MDDMDFIDVMDGGGVLWVKIWKRREKQIGVVVDNAVEMRGEIEGLVSGYKVLPSVGELELGSIGEEDG